MTVMADLANDTMNQSSVSSLPAHSERHLSMCVPPKASDGIDSYDFAKPERTDPSDETGSVVDVSSSVFQTSVV